MNNHNTHGKVIKLPGGSTAFIDGVPDKCDHEWGGEPYLLISSTQDNKLGWSYTMKEKEIFRMFPEHSKGEAIRRYDEDLHIGGHYISGGCTSCSKCGKLCTPPFW